MYLAKNYLHIFSILFLFILFPSCFPYDDSSGCEEKILCESNDECVEDYGKDFICYKGSENYNKIKTNSLINSKNKSNSCIEPEDYCTEDICKTKNIDCGDGECTLTSRYLEGQFKCTCNANTKYIKNHIVPELGTIKKCLNDYTCETNKDCEGVYEIIDNNSIETPKCSPKDKCIQHNK